jgi:hypothetical protein
MEHCWRNKSERVPALEARRIEIGEAKQKESQRVWCTNLSYKLNKQYLSALWLAIFPNDENDKDNQANDSYNEVFEQWCKRNCFHVSKRSRCFGREKAGWPPATFFGLVREK